MIAWWGQVFSSNVANVLQNYYSEQTHGIVEISENMHKSFDCLDVSNKIEGAKKQVIS